MIVVSLAVLSRAEEYFLPYYFYFAVVLLYLLYVFLCLPPSFRFSSLLEISFVSQFTDPSARF